MASTGFTIAGLGATVDTGVELWNNASRITADDGSVATSNVGSIPGSPTDSLRGSQYGFAIPDGATIDGIEVRVQLSYSAQISGTPTVATINVGKSNGVLGTQKTPGTSITTTPTNYDFGSSSDLWGLTWTPAEINASTFQALFAIANTGQLQTAQCDAMWINIHYTEAAAADATFLRPFGIFGLS